MAFQFIQGANGGVIKAWTDGVPVEDEARRQLSNAAAMPFIHKHIAVMPDVHVGKSATRVSALGDMTPVSEDEP